MKELIVHEVLNEFVFSKNETEEAVVRRSKFYGVKHVIKMRIGPILLQLGGLGSCQQASSALNEVSTVSRKEEERDYSRWYGKSVLINQ